MLIFHKNQWMTITIINDIIYYRMHYNSKQQPTPLHHAPLPPTIYTPTSLHHTPLPSIHIHTTLYTLRLYTLHPDTITSLHSTPLHSTLLHSTPLR